MTRTTTRVNDSELVNDLGARQIACDWHGGGGSALYVLCSTGAITEDLAREVNECFPAAHDEADYADIELLTIYTAHHGLRGPQAGWSSLNW